jgi:hypothetical protein
MERAAAREFKRRWERVTELEQAAQPASPEARLRQLEGLLEIARSAAWPLDKPEAETAAIRDRWKSLRSRLHGEATRRLP